jgi:hypothetical protein
MNNIREEHLLWNTMPTWKVLITSIIRITFFWYRKCSLNSGNQRLWVLSQLFLKSLTLTKSYHIRRYTYCETYFFKTAYKNAPHDCIVTSRQSVHMQCLKIWAGITQKYSAGLWARLSGVRVPAGAEFFLLTTASRPSLRPTQPPLQWIQRVLSLGSKAVGAWSWPLTSI